jgi:hypothetical protein
MKRKESQKNYIEKINKYHMSYTKKLRMIYERRKISENKTKLGIYIYASSI